MGKKVKTPGSYNLAKQKNGGGVKGGGGKGGGVKKAKVKVTPRKKVKVGRPSSGTRKGTVRKDNYRSKYTPEDLQAAFELVSDGWSVAGAAREVGVPRVTLLNKIRGTHKTGVIGRPPALSLVEERSLVDMLVLMGDYNFPVSKRYLRDLVKNYLDEKRVEPRYQNDIFEENLL